MVSSIDEAIHFGAEYSGRQDQETEKGKQDPE